MTSQGSNTATFDCRLERRNAQAELTVRRLNPGIRDDQIIELAESMAKFRLLDEELG